MNLEWRAVRAETPVYETALRGPECPLTPCCSIVSLRYHARLQITDQGCIGSNCCTDMCLPTVRNLSFQTRDAKYECRAKKLAVQQVRIRISTTKNEKNKPELTGDSHPTYLKALHVQVFKKNLGGK